MTVMECLSKHGPCTAPYIARHCGMLLGDVYGELVSAEAHGRAAIVIDPSRIPSLTRWKLGPGIKKVCE